VLKNSRPCPKCQYPIEKAGGCNQDALAAALGVFPRKRISVCKQKAKERKAGCFTPTLSAFEKLFVDQELEDLCKMNATKFENKIMEAIQEGIQSLCPAEPKASWRRRTRGSKNSKISIKELYPLKQHIPRPKDP
jgi:hypothetical protein